jgi:hypothetical protein
MEAIGIHLDRVGTRFQQAEFDALCPECGRPMIELDRLHEGDHVFIWFKCGIDNCNGQWLQKKCS